MKVTAVRHLSRLKLARLTFNPLGNDGGDVNMCFTECLGYAHIGPNESFNGMGVGGDLLVGASF